MFINQNSHCQDQKLKNHTPLLSSEIKVCSRIQNFKSQVWHRKIKRGMFVVRIVIEFICAFFFFSITAL